MGGHVKSLNPIGKGKTDIEEYNMNDIVDDINHTLDFPFFEVYTDKRNGCECHLNHKVDGVGHCHILHYYHIETLVF